MQEGRVYFALLAVVICILIALQYNLQTTHEEVPSIEVLSSWDVEKYLEENEIQLEAHQSFIWRTNFNARYEDRDYALNIIFRTKNGSLTDSIGFTQSYNNALNRYEDKKHEKEEYYFRSDVLPNDREVFYCKGSHCLCRWPDTSGTYYIYLQAGDEGWRGFAAPYRSRGGSQGDSAACIFVPFIFCVYGTVSLIPVVLILLLLRWCCRWRRIPLVVILLGPLVILLSPCGVFLFRGFYYKISL